MKLIKKYFEYEQHKSRSLFGLVVLRLVGCTLKFVEGSIHLLLFLCDTLLVASTNHDCIAFRSFLWAIATLLKFLTCWKSNDPNCTVKFLSLLFLCSLVLLCRSLDWNMLIQSFRMNFAVEALDFLNHGGMLTAQDKLFRQFNGLPISPEALEMVTSGAGHAL